METICNLFLKNLLNEENHYDLSVSWLAIKNVPNLVSLRTWHYTDSALIDALQGKTLEEFWLFYNITRKYSALPAPVALSLAQALAGLTTKVQTY